MPTVVDHVFVALVAVLLPVYGALVWYPRFKQMVAAGVPGIRLRAYQGTLAVEWLEVGAIILLWSLTGRPWPDLGLSPPGGWRFWVGVALALGAVAAGLRQLRLVARDEKTRERARAAFKTVEDILPHTPEERRVFNWVSVTAGICEEILYRGYLFWYFFWLFGLWWALVLSTALFALAHAYQGSGGLLRAGLLGLLFLLFYLLTLSLWLSMLLHAAVDLHGGQIARLLLKDAEPEPHRQPLK